MKVLTKFIYFFLRVPLFLRANLFSHYPKPSILNPFLHPKPFILYPLFFLLIACENDIEKVNLITQRSNAPTETGKGLEILYSDSAQIKVKITTPFRRYFCDPSRACRQSPIPCRA